ncbi:SH3 domain-containing protein [Amycolatopsis thermoflava]|uniref:SH3 domain-containing protein n=1 Tax=Amycolatopsis thermoflava TaxID=84480 RepID=UPI00041E1D46|nr:SH3 domain-containing protein [Amycolatopsis thermoflava]
MATLLATSAVLGGAATATAAAPDHTSSDTTRIAACAARPGPAYVAGDRVNLRSGPGTGYRILGTYNCGQQVSLLCWATPGQHPGWWYLQIWDGPTGYMRADYVANTGLGPGPCPA